MLKKPTTSSRMAAKKTIPRPRASPRCPPVLVDGVAVADVTLTSGARIGLRQDRRNLSPGLSGGLGQILLEPSGVSHTFLGVIPQLAWLARVRVSSTE